MDFEDFEDFEDYAAGARTTLVRFAAVVTDDVHLAQDIVQEVLLRARTKWTRIESMQHPEAYIRRMIINEARSGWRRTRRVEPRSDIDLGATTSDHAATYERRDELRRQLLRLPTKQRAAVVMRYLEDLPDAEIAAVLECSAGTVRVHIHRALTRMRVELADDSSESADGATLRRLPITHTA